MCSPAAIVCPPNFSNWSAQCVSPACRLKPSMDRPEPWQTPSFFCMRMTGRWNFSTSREHAMPTTPACQSSWASTMARRSGPVMPDSSAMRHAPSKMSFSTTRRFVFCAESKRAISAARAPSAVVKSSTASRACPIRPAAFKRGPSANPTSISPMFAPESPLASTRARKPMNGECRARTNPNRASTRFSPTSGTTSAIVPSAANASSSTNSSRVSFGTREPAPPPDASVAIRHASLYATPAPHNSPNGYVAPPNPGRRGCTTANACGKSAACSGGV